MVFLTQNKAKICKILIINLVFEKNANFFAENCQKSQKIVIVTSTPDQYGQVMSEARAGICSAVEQADLNWTCKIAQVKYYTIV
jgi:hypothetical protein